MVSPQQAQSSSQPSGKRRVSLSDLMYISTSLARQGLAPGVVVVTAADCKPCSSSKQGHRAGDKANAKSKSPKSKKSKGKSSKGRAKGKKESNRLTTKQKREKTKQESSALASPPPLPISASPPPPPPPPPPPTATLAAAVPPPIQRLLVREYDGRDFCGSADALAAWMNARWAKTGYSVGSEAVAGVLRAAGRCGVAVGAGDRLGGVFVR